MVSYYMRADAGKILMLFHNDITYIIYGAALGKAFITMLIRLCTGEEHTPCFIASAFD